MNDSSLRPVSNIWGGTEIRDSVPQVEHLSDLYYVPHQDNTAWGIFDNQDRMVEAAVDRAYSEGKLMAQLTDSAHRSSEVTEFFPDPVYMYGGRFVPHFGHFLVESLPRYWMLARREWRRKRPKILMHSNAPLNYFAEFPYASTIFSALEIRQEDFATSREPRRVASLIVPHASFRQQAYGHPAFQKLCRMIGDRLMGRRPLRRNKRPVWLSKSRLTHGVTKILNEDRLEAVLAAAGIEIVHPETLSLSEQIRLFASRDTVIGTVGSAFHLSIFAPPPKRIVCLAYDQNVNSNYVLFDRMNRTQAEYVYAADTQLDFADGRAFNCQGRLADPERTARDLLAMI